MSLPRPLLNEGSFKSFPSGEDLGEALKKKIRNHYDKRVYFKPSRDDGKPLFQEGLGRLPPAGHRPRVARSCVDVKPQNGSTS